MTPEWFSHRRSAFQIKDDLRSVINSENDLTGSRRPTGVDIKEYELGWYTGTYLPPRPDVRDILRSWQTVLSYRHSDSYLNEEGEEEDSIIKDADYLGKLHEFAAILNEKGHIDLAHQAITEANYQESVNGPIFRLSKFILPFNNALLSKKRKFAR